MKSTVGKVIMTRTILREERKQGTLGKKPINRLVLRCPKYVRDLKLHDSRTEYF